MVRIISWNIYCIPFFGGCEKKHLENVSQYVKYLSHYADIMIFTECFTPVAKQSIMKSLQKWSSTPIQRENFTVDSGVLIVWRKNKFVSNQTIHQITYKSCCLFDCLSDKGAIHVSLSTPKNDSLHIIGTHMQSWEVPIICNGVRKSQMNSLRIMYDNLEFHGNIKPNEPVIFAGDFNKNILRGISADLEAFNISCLESDCNTHSLGRLDHFFIRNYPISKCKQLFSHIIILNQMPNPSDHEAIYMKVDFKP